MTFEFEPSFVNDMSNCGRRGKFGKGVMKNTGGLIYILTGDPCRESMPDWISGSDK